MGLELGSVRYVLCSNFSSFRLALFPWVQECSIRAALWFWTLQEPAVVTRQQTNSKESYLCISHTEKKQSPFLSNVFFPSRRSGSYEWNSSAQMVRGWHSQSAKTVWWWEVLGVLNCKYCSVAMINADRVVYLLKTRFRQSGQPMWYLTVLVVLPTWVDWCGKWICIDANIWHWMKPFFFLNVNVSVLCTYEEKFIVSFSQHHCLCHGHETLRGGQHLSEVSHHSQVLHEDVEQR